MNIKLKIQHFFLHSRLSPIPIFLFHQVSEQRNPLTMWECDWTQIEQFKRNILSLQKQGYTFITLTEAQQHLREEWFRRRKYAVLTADDGYKSLKNILPWLQEQQIPITLFINTKYLDGQSWSELNEELAKLADSDVDMLNEVCPELYLSWQELNALTSPLIEIAMHGHEHLDATEQTLDEFIAANVEQCRELLQHHPRFVPFFAYTWGRRTKEMDNLLLERGITPVLVSGTKNYNNPTFLDRECIDGKVM